MTVHCCFIIFLTIDGHWENLLSHFTCFYRFYLLLLPAVIMQLLELLEPPWISPLVYMVTWQGSMRQVPCRLFPPSWRPNSELCLSPWCHSWIHVAKSTGREKPQCGAASVWNADAMAWGVSWISAAGSLTLKAWHLWDMCWSGEKGHGCGRV